MLVTCDLHLGKTQDCIDIEGLPSRMYDTVVRFKEMVDLAVGLIKKIVIAGDIFDNSRPSPKTIAVFFEMLDYARKKGVMVILIPGNHDCDVRLSSLLVAAKANFSNVIVIEDVDTMDIEGRTVGFIPHIPRRRMEEIEDFPGYVREKLGDEVDILIAHAHVKGVTNSSDVELEAGEAIEFDPALFPKFKVAVFGHIHKGQKFKGVTYPGSMVPCDYSEIEDVKGFIRLEGTDVHVLGFKHVGMEYKHITVDLVNKDSVEFEPDRVKKLVENKLVKITVYTSDPLKVDEYEMRKAFNEFGRVTRFETIINRPDSEMESVDDTEDVSYEDLFEEWLDGMEGVEPDVQAGTLEYGKTLIADVLSKEAV